MARNGMVRGGVIGVGGGGREEGMIMNGVVERFIFMGSLILINLKGIIMETVVTGAFTGGYGLLVFLGKDESLIIEEVIKSTRMEMMEIRAEADESGDDG